MDAGQITQGLRADVLAQAASQGVNVTQLMASGVSFADIMLMLVQNQQQTLGANIDPNAAEQPLMQDNHNMTDDMLLPFMQNCQNPAEMEQVLNIQNQSDSQKVLYIPNEEQVQDENQQNSVQIPQDANVQNTVQVPVPQEENVQNTVQIPNKEIVQNAVQIPNKENVQNVVQIPNKENVQSAVQVPNKEIVQNTVQIPNRENVQNAVQVPQEENLQNAVQVPQEENLQNAVHVPQEENLQNTVRVPNKEIVQNTVQIPNRENVQNAVQVPQEENLQNAVHVPQEENVQNTVQVPQEENVQNAVQVPQGENVPDQEQKVDFPFNREYMPQFDIRHYNVQNKNLNSHKTADFSEVQNADKTVLDDKAKQRLAEILGAISPEIMKSTENTSSYSNNSFVGDLFSELPSEGEMKDSFDFSDSMLKVDPTQLAGLLNFIGTGNSIPVVSDISDNELFSGIENIENISKIQSSSDKLLFNPEEMIKSGEMEIVSYIPAENNSQSSSSQQNNHKQMSDDETIDLARTMKSAKENVSNDMSEDSVKFSEMSAMAAANPDDLARKVDISFDRAYAELEMNKAKYGSADEQMYKGIADNLEKGRSEFTVKLRPEGLGEILVKLVSDEGGKAVLSLVASSEKTAELLNRDLATLQSSLNQLDVEIENNTVKTTQTVVHAETTAFDQFSERQQDEANQQHHFRNLKNKLGNVSDRNASFEPEDEILTQSAVDSALNIKI